MKRDVILALDPAFRLTGWSIFDIKSRKLLEYGVIKVNKESMEILWEGIDKIATELIGIINKYQPLYIYSEVMSGSRSQRTAQLLGAVDACIVSLARAYKIPLYMIKEYIVKTVLFKRRSVSKEEMINYVRKFYKIEGKKKYLHNIADSVAVYMVIRDLLTGEVENHEKYLQQLYIQG